MIAFLIAARVPSRRFANTKGVNVLARRARRMRWPSSRGARSRTIVSTSGSSGTLDLPPPDVAPPRLPLERDALARRGAPLRRLRHRVTDARHGEHAPAAHAQRAV